MSHSEIHVAGSHVPPPLVPVAKKLAGVCSPSRLLRGRRKGEHQVRPTAEPLKQTSESTDENGAAATAHLLQPGPVARSLRGKKPSDGKVSVGFKTAG